MTPTAPARRHIASAVVIGCLVTPLAAAAQQPEVATTVAFTEGPDGRSRRQRLLHRHHQPADHEARRRRRALHLPRAEQRRQRAADRPAGAVDRLRRRGLRAAGCQGARHAAGDPHRPEDRPGRDARRQLRRQAAGRAQRRDHRRPGPPVFHRAEWRRRLPHRRAGEDRADSRRARRPQSERHPDLARRPDAVPRRSQRDAGWSTADPPLRPPARRHRPQHAGALRLLARPQRRRDEHRQPGQPLRLGRDEPAARHRGNAGDQDRGLRDLSRRHAAEVHPDCRGLHHQQRLRRPGHADALRDRRQDAVQVAHRHSRVCPGRRSRTEAHASWPSIARPALARAGVSSGPRSAR